MKEKTQWFIEPIGDEANSIIGNDLAEMQMAYEVTTTRFTPNSLPVRAYGVPSSYIEFIEKTKAYKKVKMRAWSRIGNAGRFTEHKFTKRNVLGTTEGSVMAPENPFPYYPSKIYKKTLTVEQIVFLPKIRVDGKTYRSGYSFLRIKTRELDKVKDKDLIERIKLVLRIADRKVPVVKCQCGQHTALYAWIGTNISGSTISFAPSARYGEKCKYVADVINAKLVDLKFVSIGSFSNSVEQRRFIQLLKYCIFGKWNVKISAQKAFDFFFGGPQLDLFNT